MQIVKFIDAFWVADGILLDHVDPLAISSSLEVLTAVRILNQILRIVSAHRLGAAAMKPATVPVA